jgi:O-antigen/teichoic acid export membrane protein
MKDSNKFIGKDFLWYFIGNICPIIIGIVKFPIYTRIFSPADFGAYSLIMLVFTYASIVCYSWINGCAWRFYFEYKRNDKTKHLFTNLSLLFSVFTLFILAGTLIYYFSSDNALIKRLVVYCFLQYFTSELLSLFLIVPRLEGRSFLYNFIQSVKAIGSFGLLLLLTFYNGSGIEAFLTSNVILNAVLLLIILPPSIFKLNLSFKWINKKDLATLFAYGKVGLLINICSTLLISSDRFLIEHYATLNEVGIYNQNYNIAQITISTLIATYWASLNPTILSGLDTKSASLKTTIPGYFNTYFFCTLPIALYAILYAKEIAEIMLGVDFRAGYSIIAWVAFSEFIIGLYFVPVTKLKLDNNLKILSIYYVGALVANVVLNIFFIQHFGYKSSAIVSAIVYLLLLLCVYRHDVFDSFPQLLRSPKLKQCLGIVLMQVAIHVISARFDLSVYYYIIEGFIFALMYVYFAIKNRWISLSTEQFQTHKSI